MQRNVSGKKQLFTTQQLVVLALLVALQVVLGKFVQINLIFKEINLGFLPVAVAGALLGPVPAVVVGALGDVIGSLLFPTGLFRLGFTLTAGLVGLAYGLALFRRTDSLLWAVIAMASGAVINLLLNSYWLSDIYGSKTYWGWIVSRAGTYPFEVVVQTAVTYLFLRVLGRIRLPKFIRIPGKDVSK